MSVMGPMSGVNINNGVPAARPGFWRLAGLLASVLVTTTAGALGLGLISKYILTNQGSFYFEIILPLLLVYGAVSLLLALAAVVAILADYDLTNKSQPLGLPEGSIRAVLSLSLLLIFVITALYVYSRESGNDPKAAQPIATELITTVGTLAVAVAGFYFGSKSVEAGAAAAQGAAAMAASVSRSIRIAQPSSPATGPAEGEVLRISVETIPPGQKVEARLYGDTGGTLTEDVQVPGQYLYTPGPAPTEPVLCLFTIAGDPSVGATLEVRRPTP